MRIYIQNSDSEIFFLYTAIQNSDLKTAFNFFKYFASKK